MLNNYISILDMCVFFAVCCVEYQKRKAFSPIYRIF